jgi:hypothetical protein
VITQGVEPARGPAPEAPAGNPDAARACRSVSRLAVAAALGAPGLVVAGLIAAYGIDVPFWDAWEWLARHLDAQGPLDLAPYWRLHNEHRVFVALLVDRWLLEAWGFSMWGRLWAKPAVVGVELGLVWALWRRSVPGAGAGAALGLALLLWSLAYWPLWVDPRQLSLHLAAACLLGALRALVAPRRWSAFLAAAGLTGLASVSYGPGLFAWPAAGLAAWMAGYRRRSHLAVWVGLAVGVWASHAVDLAALGGRAVEGPGRPWRVPLFALAFVGQPVAPALRGWFYGPTLMLGAAGLAAAAAAAWVTLRTRAAAHQLDDRRQAALGVWAALVVWGLLSAVAAGVSRDAVYGVTEAHAPRYAHVGSLFWVGVFGTLSVARAAPTRSRVRRRLHVGVAGLLCAVAAGSAAVTIQRLTDGFDELPVRLSAGRECLDRRPGVDDSCLELLYPQGPRLRALVADLERRGAAFLEPDGSWRAFGLARLVRGPGFAYDLVAVAEALRFDRARADPVWPPATRPIVVRLDRTIHWPVLEQRAPAALHWRLRLPEAGRIGLRTGTLVRPLHGLEPSEARALLMEVGLAARGRVHRLAWRRRGPEEWGGEVFERLDLDLTPWAGETIELSVTVRCAEARAACGTPAVVLWQYPAITPPPAEAAPPHSP